MKVGAVIKLENNVKYAIAEIITYDSFEYLYIVNIDNVNDIRFAVIENDKINFVDNNDMFDRLLVEVAKKNIFKRED